MYCSLCTKTNSYIDTYIIYICIIYTHMSYCIVANCALGISCHVVSNQNQNFRIQNHKNTREDNDDRYGVCFTYCYFIKFFLVSNFDRDTYHGLL